MSHKVLDQAWSAKGLPPAEKLALVALADHTDTGGHCWPTMQRLAERTGLSIRSVRRAIDALDRADHLSRERVGRRHYHYHVHPGRSDAPREDTESARNLHASGQPVRSKGTQCPLEEDTESGRIEPSRNRQRTSIERKQPIKNDWQPTSFPNDTQSQKIVASWSADELAMQVEAFKAHHTANGSRHIDWQAAWSKWVLISVRFAGTRQQRGPDDSDGLGPFTKLILQRRD